MSHSRLFLSENSLRIIYFPLLKQQHSYCPSFATFDRQTVFLHIFRVSWNHLSKTHGKTEGEVIFSPSDKNFESPYFIDN